VAPADPSQVLRLLAELLAPYIRSELVPKVESASLVDLATVPPGKRRCYRAARFGEIRGALRLQRRWFAPAAAYEEWRDSIATRPSSVSAAPRASVDDLRERLGLRRTG
jgi:hypothetical protein